MDEKINYPVKKLFKSVLSIFKYTEEPIEYHIYKNGNINIIDSWKFKNDEYKIYFLQIIGRDPNVNFGKRSMKSLIIEWKAHNILYNKKILRKRTGSTCLDQKESLIRRIFYHIVCFIFKEK